MRKLKNYTEEEALSIIQEVCRKLAPNFAFGYYDTDDIIQEGQILALKAIESGAYDENRPLRNFLFIYLKNRFINLKRDKYYRVTPPCKSCPLYDPQFKCSKNGCGGYEDMMECDKYNIWVTLNTAKRNLVDSIDIDNVDMEYESNAYENSYLVEGEETNEIKDYIDTHLPIEMRSDYLKMLSNYGVKYSHRVKINTERTKEVQTTISGILVQYYESKTR